MKTSMKYYFIIWIVIIVAFNAVVFMVRPVIPGYTINYDMRFWIAWFFIMVAFGGNLLCTWIAMRSGDMAKLFYNIPLITISWSALIAVAVIGCIMMLIPDFPAWITAVLCIVITAIYAIALAKASWASDVVQKVDERVKDQTSFIRNLTVEVENIMARAGSDEVRAECRKVYEAVRYSDPVSREGLSEIEGEIAARVDELSNMISSGDTTGVRRAADEILVLVNNRNRKCKAAK